MMDTAFIQQTARIANEALIKIDLHMEQCTLASGKMASSVERLHERMDQRIGANRVMMVGVITAAASSIIQIGLHFWK